MPKYAATHLEITKKTKYINSIKKRLVKIIMRVRMWISPGMKSNVNFFPKCTIKNEILGKMTA